jgi:hypothetical protein
MVLVKLPCGCVAQFDNGSPTVEFVEACEDCAARLGDVLHAQAQDDVESQDEHDRKSEEEYLN